MFSSLHRNSFVGDRTWYVYLSVVGGGTRTESHVPSAGFPATPTRVHTGPHLQRAHRRFDCSLAGQSVPDFSACCTAAGPPSMPPKLSSLKANELPSSARWKFRLPFLVKRLAHR